MKVLYFRDQDGGTKDPTPTSDSDESTLVFDSGEIVNVDVDDQDTITIYTEGRQWYLILTVEELITIKRWTT